MRYVLSAGATYTYHCFKKITRAFSKTLHLLELQFCHKLLVKLHAAHSGDVFLYCSPTGAAQALCSPNSWKSYLFTYLLINNLFAPWRMLEAIQSRLPPLSIFYSCCCTRPRIPTHFSPLTLHASPPGHLWWKSYIACKLHVT